MSNNAAVVNAVKGLVVATLAYQGYYLYSQIQKNPGPYFQKHDHVDHSKNEDRSSLDGGEEDGGAKAGAGDSR